ncbi:hypothetical protein I7I50_01971 [Histoplasma capsulatum G186AR]|uniref:Uncharacterized protein n=1 Tax=Ajellomyces capsulatus TaxID=5037 RepID=A0A8H7YFE4_AJECA|nr:hypothetical protein I7I52_12185 [Histoplasma capsulatum]QSS71217.1 hypothetical protein I7I50_01971 [Histoplasma capsulatum G186AR]
MLCSPPSPPLQKYTSVPDPWHSTHPCAKNPSGKGFLFPPLLWVFRSFENSRFRTTQRFCLSKQAA